MSTACLSDTRHGNDSTVTNFKRQKGELSRRFRTIASAAYCERTNVECYRKDLTSCLRSIVEFSREIHNFLRRGKVRDTDAARIESSACFSTTTLDAETKDVRLVGNCVKGKVGSDENEVNAKDSVNVNVQNGTTHNMDPGPTSVLEHHYDCRTIEDCLSSSLSSPVTRTSCHWKDLCLDHDSNLPLDNRTAWNDHFNERSQNSPQYNVGTALQETLQLLLDPCIIPVSCSSAIFMTLLRVLVESCISGSSRNKSSSVDSHAVISTSLDKLIANRPSMFIGKRLFDYLESRLRLSVSTTPDHSEPRRQQQQRQRRRNDIESMLRQSLDRYDDKLSHGILTLLTRYAKSYHNLGWAVYVIKCLVCTVREIDDVDVALLRIRHGRNKRRSLSFQFGGKRKRMDGLKRGSCPKCGKANFSRVQDGVGSGNGRRCRTRRPKTADLSTLHDGTEEDENVIDDGSGMIIRSTNEDTSEQVVRLKYSFKDEEEKLTLKKFVTTCPTLLATSGEPISCSCDCDMLVECNEKSTTSSAMLAHAKSRASEFTLLPLKMAMLRSRLYRKILSVMTILLMSNPRETLSLTRKLSITSTSHSIPNLMNNIDAPAPLTAPPAFGLVINMLSQYPMSSSVRLCAVLIADARGWEGGYLFLMKRLFDFCVKSMSPTCVEADDGDLIGEDRFLRIYSELAVDCAIFDNPAFCVRVMGPLVDIALVLDRVLQRRVHERFRRFLDKEKSKTDDMCRFNSENWDKAEARFEILSRAAIMKQITALLRTLSYILVQRRSTLFMDADSSEHSESRALFNQLVAQLSVAFDKPWMWVTPDMPLREKEKVINTLQAAGILSFIDDECEENDVFPDNIPDGNGSYRTSIEWPFPETTCIRSAYKRMGPKVDCGGLFSSITEPRKEVVKPRSTKRDASDSKETRMEYSMSSAPVSDYLQEDMLRVVFSFLGYKRLVRVEGVSKLWNRLAKENQFWEKLYSNRYKVIFEDEEMRKMGGYDQPSGSKWKEVFAQRRAQDRATRWKVSAKGFKYRSCDYVGCLCVLRSGEQLERHYQKHEQDTSKRERRRIAAEKKRKKIEEKEKEEMEKVARAGKAGKRAVAKAKQTMAKKQLKGKSHPGQKLYEIDLGDKASLEAKGEEGPHRTTTNE